MSIITEKESNPAKKKPTNPLPYFMRHETFHPRFGWLKKGFDKVIADTNVFNRDDAPVILGVGKNMVRAIRYWCYAFKVIYEKLQNEKTVTDLGMKLLSDDGWDPYLEDTGSLWLLHWHLVEKPYYATAWYYTFNIFHQREFTMEELKDSLATYKETYFPESQIVSESLNKDIDCLRHMYVKRKGKDKNRQESKDKTPIEDSIDCPFVDLGIIQQTSDSMYYVFNTGKKSNLPDQIIVYACLKFASSVSPEARSIVFKRLRDEEGSPGRIFKLDHSSLYEAIENVASNFKHISLSDTAGIIQLFYDSHPEELADNILNSYYRK